MKERPILFSAPMVRAILSGRKTQTRRIVKPQPHDTGLANRAGSREYIHVGYPGDQDETDPRARFGAWQTGGWLAWCPYGGPGGRLWVRETWCHEFQANGSFCYRADQDSGEFVDCDGNPAVGSRWRPSIHMPRRASRITLEMTGVRVERLQEISEADAEAEGAAFTCPQCGNDLDDEHGTEVHAACDDPDMGSHGEGFRRIWTAINGSGSWDANPFVWCLSFRRIET